jgi:ATP/maltotriose-dependent transcriptional regulator MalT
VKLVFTIALAAFIGCAYPQTAMEPMVRRGEAFEAGVTAALERGDFAEAYRLCERWLALAHESGTPVNLVAVHETILWIRWAEHDAAGAMAESDAVGQAARRCDGEARRMALMHHWWCRAWLEAEAGRADEAAAAYAALERVSTQPGGRTSLPVLAAWLALARGDVAGAMAAMRAVTPTPTTTRRTSTSSRASATPPARRGCAPVSPPVRARA